MRKIRYFQATPERIYVAPRFKLAHSMFLKHTTNQWVEGTMGSTWSMAEIRRMGGREISQRKARQITGIKV